MHIDNYLNYSTQKGFYIDPIVEFSMTERVKPIGKSFRDSLKSRKVQIMGTLGAGAALLAPNVAAANATFDFTILTDLGTAIVDLIPTANLLIDGGGPLVIKFCIVAAVCAPFIWVYAKAHGRG